MNIAATKIVVPPGEDPSVTDPGERLDVSAAGCQKAYLRREIGWYSRLAAPV
jgi:hypothetical protein